ncbi:hypothetical protein AKJ47_00460 [candidate division MSBL1 archaeon SCGC-AAA261G05]|uniref:Uncharacterized protein n=2 Tax=candidate division MSBL1 TaxID=215777 RepID=A0A133V1G9_9EURY|nr:hypothetical protein AKJ42_01205 [candidate division MSBL1 archaeon SCGC-AAA261C02]KXB04155.1 hypothetical protein AKJ47_00460 [candidate division MSBL1 archaeon SCGC-AAA261G05]
MLNMSQAGVATVTITVAVVAVAGGAVGTPVAVDEMDVQAGSPLYGLERAGETIKEATFAGGQGWEIARGHERTSEFVNMANKRKAEGYTGLLNEAEDRFKKAIESAGDVKGLQKAKKAINKHISTLENVREKVPDVAKPAISLAISQSARGKSVVADVAAGKSPGEELGETVRERVRTQLREIKQETKTLRKKVKENLEKAPAKANEIVQNIEINTAKKIANQAKEMVKKNKGQCASGVIEEAQCHLETAAMFAENETGLEKAISASQKHLSTLQSVYENVPDVAKPAISLAMQRSSQYIKVLENVKENQLSPGEQISNQIRERIRNRVYEIKENVKKIQEQVRNRIREAAGRASEISKIIQEYENKAKRIVESVTENQEENESSGTPGKGSPPF